MERETIQDAAEEYVMSRSASYTECFEAGAEWRVQAAWHDCQKELPEKEGEWVLLEAEILGRAAYLPVEWENDGKGATKPMKRWAYIDDLLPQEKREG